MPRRSTGPLRRLRLRGPEACSARCSLQTKDSPCLLCSRANVRMPELARPRKPAAGVRVATRELYVALLGRLPDQEQVGVSAPPSGAAEEDGAETCARTAVVTHEGNALIFAISGIARRGTEKTIFVSARTVGSSSCHAWCFEKQTACYGSMEIKMMATKATRRMMIHAAGAPIWPRRTGKGAVLCVNRCTVTVTGAVLGIS